MYRHLLQNKDSKSTEDAIIQLAATAELPNLLTCNADISYVKRRRHLFAVKRSCCADR